MSQNITFRWRCSAADRSAPWGGSGADGVPVKGVVGSASMAARNFLRSPSGRPSSRRSASLRVGSTAASIFSARKISICSAKPISCNQLAMSMAASLNLVRTRHALDSEIASSLRSSQCQHHLCERSKAISMKVTRVEAKLLANYSRGPKVGPIPTMRRSLPRTRSRSRATYGCSAAIACSAATAQWRPTLRACSVASRRALWSPTRPTALITTRLGAIRPAQCTIPTRGLASGSGCSAGR